MGIGILDQNLGEISIEGLNLKKLLGHYEFNFSTKVDIFPQREQPNAVSLYGARIALELSNQVYTLGTGWPEKPQIIFQKMHQHTTRFLLRFPVESRLINDIEEKRGGNDLLFRLDYIYQELDSYHVNDETVQYRLARSDWIDLLNSIDARNTVSLEISSPIAASDTSYLQAANRQFFEAKRDLDEGKNEDCVSKCRSILENARHEKYGSENQKGKSLDIGFKDKKDMSKEDREAHILATVRHYTHLPHHAESEGGNPEYSRGEAELILNITASFLKKIVKDNSY